MTTTPATESTTESLNQRGSTENCRRCSPSVARTALEVLSLATTVVVGVLRAGWPG